MNININKKISILAVEHPYERHARSILSILFIVLVCAYLYFVAASVLNVIARKEALDKVSSMEGTIGTLENQYFALSQNVTPARASNLGLILMGKPSYVHRPGNVGDAGTRENNAI